MPGPTTEVLNEDIKELKADLREIRTNMDTLRADVHSIALSVKDLSSEMKVAVAQLATEVRVTFGILRWAGALLVVTALTSGVGAVWWAATTGVQVKRTSVDVEAMRKELDSLKVVTPTPPQPKAIR